nr:MAG TPA: hypothetical protein [Caudoviricetes sp.]
MHQPLTLFRHLFFSQCTSVNRIHLASLNLHIKRPPNRYRLSGLFVLVF